MQRHQAPLKELKESGLELQWEEHSTRTTEEEETEREKKLNQRETLEVRKEKSTMKAVGGAFNVHRQRKRRRRR